MKKWLLIAITTAFVACGDDKVAESSAQKNADSTKIAESSAESNIEKIVPNTADSATPTQNANLAKTAESNPNPANLYKKCIACHGEKGDKVAPGSVGSVLIADLSKETLIADLKGYRAKTLSKGGTAAIMYLQVNGFSDADIEVLGEYIASFKK